MRGRWEPPRWPTTVQQSLRYKPNLQVSRRARPSRRCDTPSRLRHNFLRGKRAKHLTVEHPIGCQRAAVPRPWLAGGRGESTTPLLENRNEGGDVIGVDPILGRNVEQALREQGIRPQVAVGAVAPHPCSQIENRGELPCVSPLRETLKTQGCIGELRHARYRNSACGGCDKRAGRTCSIRYVVRILRACLPVHTVCSTHAIHHVCPRTVASRSPPPSAESRCRCHANHRVAVHRKCDEGAPHRDSTKKVGCPIDGVDDPRAGRAARARLILGATKL